MFWMIYESYCPAVEHWVGVLVGILSPLNGPGLF